MNRLYAVSQGTANLGVNTVAPKSAYFEFKAASQLPLECPHFLARCYDDLVAGLADLANAWA
ncbi:MAG: hypothetical protein ACTHK7_16090 [Aureliella sp.]